MEPQKSRVLTDLHTAVSYIRTKGAAVTDLIGSSCRDAEIKKLQQQQQNRLQHLDFTLDGRLKTKDSVQLAARFLYSFLRSWRMGRVLMLRNTRDRAAKMAELEPLEKQVLGHTVYVLWLHSRRCPKVNVRKLCEKFFQDESQSAYWETLVMSCSEPECVFPSEALQCKECAPFSKQFGLSPQQQLELNGVQVSCVVHEAARCLVEYGTRCNFLQPQSKEDKNRRNMTHCLYMLRNGFNENGSMDLMLSVRNFDESDRAFVAAALLQNYLVSVNEWLFNRESLRQFLHPEPDEKDKKGKRKEKTKKKEEEKKSDNENPISQQTLFLLGHLASLGQTLLAGGMETGVNEQAICDWLGAGIVTKYDATKDRGLISLLLLDPVCPRVGVEYQKCADCLLPWQEPAVKGAAG